MQETSKKPALRFAGFNDAWEQRKLDDILVQRVEHQTISPDAPLLAFSYAEGVINPEDKKSNKRDFIMTDKFNKVFSRTELNDIIYNPANTGMAMPKLNQDVCRAIPILSPCYEEQKLIGIYFRALDNLITLHQREQIVEE